MKNVVKTIKLNPLQGSRSMELLENPDRGFRLEVALDVGLRINPLYTDYKGITQYLRYQYDYYKADKPKLVQSYFYLSQFEERDLDETAFESMNTFLEELRSMKLKSVLRFAYETDFKGPKGAMTERILAHMKQLAPFLERNKDVIHVYQAGFIGAWGEWHNSKYELDMKAILEGITDMVPKELQIQTRLPIYKNLISKDNPNYKRIGFHDDFIVIVPHAWDGGLNPETEQYKQMVDESSTLLIDGELPWGWWSMEEEAWLINGYETIKRLAEHRYTSLSLVHNYRENGDQKLYSMKLWKEQEITAEWLENNKLPFSKDWFYNESGENIKRSIFEYIRDHLGYNIEAIELEVIKHEEVKDAIKLSLKIKNNGFAAPIGLHRCSFVLSNEKGEILQSVPVENPKSWYTGEHMIKACIDGAELSKRCFVGISLQNYSGEAVRLANDLRFENGINYLCEI